MEIILETRNENQFLHHLPYEKLLPEKVELPLSAFDFDGCILRRSSIYDGK